MHIWEYRNPYDRKCLGCGHRENMYARVFGTDDGGEYVAHQWWEVVYPLSDKPCPGIIRHWLGKLFLVKN